MPSSIHSALLSVGEVAVFAFSLLDLLLTRILPLAGFLAAHLLLHFCRLLGSIIVFASGRRKPRGEYSYLPAEEPLEDACVQNNENWQDHENEETLNDRKLKDRQQHNIVSNDEPVVLHESAISATQVAAEIVDHLNVADTTPSDAQIIDSRPSSVDAEGAAMPSTQAAAERGEYHVEVADSTPSGVKIMDMPGPSNLPVLMEDNNQAQAQVYESGRFDVGDSGDKSQVVKSESSDSINGLGSVQRSEGGATVDEVRPSTKIDEMRRDGSRKRRMQQVRVLPPSLSQIKRTLMQRSRRSSPLQPTSPYVKPIKRQSPRTRKFASALHSSASNDNFLRKFRNHFLLDSAA